jgi:fructose-1,6-bisphosphatase/inositol monophosphatase family enzyme
VTGGIACKTKIEAKRAGKLNKRLFQHVGQRRALGNAALELAWTAAGRIDVCFHEQWLHPWDVDAGLFICQRGGLRVHRLLWRMAWRRACSLHANRSPPRFSSSSDPDRRSAGVRRNAPP